MNSDLHAQARLAHTINSVIQRSIHRQRLYVETLAEQQVKNGTAVGIVELDQAGESIIDIQFPLHFLERPIFTAGLELRPNTPLSWGSFPTWSATVARWALRSTADTDLYIGAQLAVVTTGADRTNLHYSFQARSITMPSGPGTSVGQTI